MGTYREVEGDLIKMAINGDFDVITMGCNCFCTMGAGIAPQMAKAFGCDKYPLEGELYRGNTNKLGQIDYDWFNTSLDSTILRKPLYVINSYTQFHYGKNHLDGVSKPLDYEALTLCLRKINHVFKGKHIGLPAIGAGLAGGIWDYGELKDAQRHFALNNLDKKTGLMDLGPLKYVVPIKTIIQKELKDMDVTVVIYKL